MKEALPRRRLYWFHPHFYNWMGGHKYIYEVATRLNKNYNTEVVIITSGLTQKANRRFDKAGIPVIKLFGLSTNNPFYWLMLPLFLMAEKWYLLNIKKIDSNAWFMASMFPSNYLAASINAKTAQLCYEPFAFFYDSHFIKTFNWSRRLFISVVSFLYKGLDKASIKKAKVVFTLSEFNKNWIKKIYGIPAQVVYEGVDLDFFHPATDKEINNTYRQHSLIFHATDYTSLKGTGLLIDALPEVVKRIPGIKLIISETMQNRIAKEALTKKINNLGLEKYVEFVGFLPYEKLPVYLSLAHVVVQPSVNQSMNLTVKEAMACETPIITSPEGSEQTPDGVAGYLVDPHDSFALASRIIDCILNKQQSTHMGQEGRRIIKEKFSWDSVTDKIWSGLLKSNHD